MNTGSIAQLERSDAHSKFLEHFPERRRALIANIFLRAVRAGEADPTAIVAAVKKNVFDRLRWHGDIDKLQHILTVLDGQPEEAEDYARWCLAWEALPIETRNVEKGRRSELYQREYMAQQAPTEKQLLFLRKHNWDQPVKSRLHASELIEQIKRGQTSG